MSLAPKMPMTADTAAGQQTSASRRAAPCRRQDWARRGLLGLLLVILACQVLADGPQPKAPQPPAAASAPSSAGKGGSGFRTGKPQRVAFLGVISAQPTPEQRARAGLPEGMGLTVLYVVGDSPAQAAGLQRFDQLQKYNDQLLINEEQLRVLVRSTKPGETVELTLVRAAKPLKLSVRLVEREVSRVEGTGDNMGLWVIKPGPGGAAAPRLGFSARYKDERHVLELTVDQQRKHLVAKDKRGAVIFDGPVDTPQQRQSVPEALRPKLERLESPPAPELQPVPPRTVPAPDLS